MPEWVDVLKMTQMQDQDIGKQMQSCYENRYISEYRLRDLQKLYINL